MADIKMQGITSYHSGQNSTERGEKEPKVKIRSNVARLTRNIGQPDPLAQALKVHTPILPSGSQVWSHSKTPAARGHRYSPAGFNGKPTLGSMSAGKATDYPSHTSRPGANPLGNHSNRKGDNPLGRALNHRGANPLGSPTNRKGSDANGTYGNKLGAKSGYPHFAPRGGGKNV